MSVPPFSVRAPARYRDDERAGAVLGEDQTSSTQLIELAPVIPAMQPATV